MTLQTWLKENSKQVNPTDISTNNLILRSLLSYLLDKSNAWLYTHPEHILLESDIKQLNRWLTQINEGVPLAYITGQQNFWDLDLEVNQSTLIPRPDTEALLETVIELLANNQPKNILDLGTGSGALALSLARIYPKAKIIAVDKSSAALVVAKQNAKVNLINNVTFYQSDWFENIPSQTFDLIVSNPPYIADDDSHLSDLTHEPIDALVADQNGLGDFIRIADQAHLYLQSNGMLIFEHGWQQKESVHLILNKAGFHSIASRKDLAGHDRVTFGFMV